MNTNMHTLFLVNMHHSTTFLTSFQAWQLASPTLQEPTGIAMHLGKPDPCLLIYMSLIGNLKVNILHVCFC